MSEEPSITQEEVTYHLYEDELKKSRTLSDAELLQNGAEYRKGVLTPTKQQLENLKQSGVKRHTEFAMADAANDARKILFNEQEAEVFAPMSEVIAHREKLEEFRAVIQTALRPYEGIFFGEVPLRSPNDPPKFGKQLDKEWKIESKYDGIEAVTFFDLKYTPDQYGDRLDTVNMTLNSKDALSRYRGKILSPGFTFTYEAGQLSKIRTLHESAGLHYMMSNVSTGRNIFAESESYRYEDMWPNGAPTTPLEKFAQLCSFGDFYEGSIEIDLSSDKPGIRFMRGYNHEGYIKGLEVSTEYTYDTKADKFLLTLNKNSDPERTPIELSKEDFLMLIKAPLELIPTMEY